MAFWTYMLHCRGGRFYVGHTDDLDRRIGEHRCGLIPGFTADHLPVELVWSETFQTREEAKAAERKLKGWSRAKKLALIRGDWEPISMLAKNKGSASTSSAETDPGETLPQNPARPELVEGLSFALEPHRDTPPKRITAVCVVVSMTDGCDVLLQFRVEDGQGLKLARPVTPLRKDGLWQSTCFEMFLREPGKPNYWEFNFSPSGEWAAYQFAAYREGMQEFPVDVAPHVERTMTGCQFQLDSDVDLGRLPRGNLELALSAVIEETDGTKSYWALAHPPGKPDFHAATCFAATLAAPQSP